MRFKTRILFLLLGMLYFTAAAQNPYFPVTLNMKARAEVIDLVEHAGMRGIHAGPIENAAAAEALTSVLIVINKRYKCHASIKITGID